MTLLPISKTQLKSLLKPQAGSLSARGRAKTPERSRSRSRSRSKSKGKTINLNKRSGQFRKQFIKSSIAKLKPLVDRKELVGKTVALAKSGYFSDKDSKTVDLKTTQGEYDNLVKEIQLAIGAIKAGLGDRPIRLKLSQSFTLTATVTTGVVTTWAIGGGNNRFTPGDASEWSSVAALFDEVKVLGGHLTLTYPTYTASGGNQTADRIPTIGYDLDSSTAASSSEQICQLAQHEQLYGIWSFGSPAVAIMLPNHHFRWHTPSATVVSVDNPGKGWVACPDVTGFTQVFGYMKFYHVQTIVTATAVGAGIIYYEIEVRCRR
jgi:hypothetical protein